MALLVEQVTMSAGWEGREPSTIPSGAETHTCRRTGSLARSTRKRPESRLRPLLWRAYLLGEQGDSMRPDDTPTPRREPSPAAYLYGPGHRIVYGNAAFVAEFGRESIGLPAVEALPALPAAAFELLDLAYREGRSVAAWTRLGGVERRLVVAVRRDIETEEVYGLAVHLVARERVAGPLGQDPRGGGGSLSGRAGDGPKTEARS